MPDLLGNGDFNKLKRRFVTQFFMENEDWIDLEMTVYKKLLEKNNAEQVNKFIVEEYFTLSLTKENKRKAIFTDSYIEERGRKLMMILFDMDDAVG